MQSQNTRVLFPPIGSEAALMGTAEYCARQILSSIYYDLSTNCHFQRNANADAHSNQVHNNLVAATVEFMDLEFRNYMVCVEAFKRQHGEYQALTPDNRFFSFVSQVGWQMLAICAHTEVFRRAFREADHRLWGCLLRRIQENSLSIMSYVHSRGMNWTKLICNVQDPLPGLPSVRAAIESRLNWKVDHPHHTVITRDNGLKEPFYNGHLQEHIDQSIYDPKNFNHRHQYDPTAKSFHTSQHGCYLCGNNSSCGCVLQSRAGDMVELTEYEGKGTGIRTLAAFDRGDILDVFVGELTHNLQDHVYPLTQSVDRQTPCGNNILCYIAPHRYGNWTRFINHSCQPSTQFVVRTIGDRVVTTVEAMRRISAFEELTIDYGGDYWTCPGKSCSCGHWNCRSKTKQTEGKDNKTQATRKA